MSDAISSQPEADAVVAACLDADGVSPLEHFPVDAEHVLFVVDSGGRPAAVGVLAAGPVWRLAVATHPQMRGRGAGVRAAEAAVAHAGRVGGRGRIDMWVPGALLHPEVEPLAYHLDFALTRRLLRLEVDLGALAPVEVPAPYRFDTAGDDDVDAIVAVNNRAFAWHEDQGSWTAAELRERLREKWVDRSGFVVAREGDRIAGFCWTKLHGGGRPVGEIYVICTDPSDAGRGLGRALTLAGLTYLASSVGTGMLYVDDGNLPARRVYRRLGFHLARVDARYTRDPTLPPFGGVVSR